MANRRYVSYPKVAGRTSRQAHADFPSGTYERELGKEGFFGPATHMYHRHPPTGWVDWKGPLRPRCFDLNRIDAAAGSPWDAPVCLHNPKVQLAFWRAPNRMAALARNGDGDQLIFVHEGAGDLFCDYGHLEFAAGDYIVVPRSTMWRLECAAPVSALLIEATNGSLMLPDKGMVGQHAIFDPAMLDVPQIDDAFLAQQGEVETRVQIKRRGAVSTVTYPFNPLDAVGWSGDLAVCRINVRHIRPLMSHRYHLPPSAHTTFVGPGFVVCTFCPRPIETDPGALKLPFFHNNDDFDEVIFYHRGDFTSRDNIEAGMVTFHPCGFTHGPHPKALRGMFEAKREATNEYAVMLDTRDALEISEAASAVENQEYVHSWRSPGEPAPNAKVPAGE